MNRMGPTVCGQALVISRGQLMVRLREAQEHPTLAEIARSVLPLWAASGGRMTFKLSNDPRFAEKLEDVVSLYLQPPDNAIVLSVDEKCQIQALDRTQPGLPWKKGRCGTMTTTTNAMEPLLCLPL